jgi:hypothetical protein
MTPFEREIAGLEGSTMRELQIVWRQLHRRLPPAHLSRDLLIRALAYSMQERAYGGLAPAVRRRLRELAEKNEVTRAGAFALGASLTPGTRLVREWRGVTHTVIVLDDGFEHLGQRYRSLTEIAKQITGAHWSGPRFFRTRKPAAGPAVVETGNA